MQRRTGVWGPFAKVLWLWNNKEQSLILNILELKAAKMAIMVFTRFKEVRSVHIQMDSITTLTYLVRMWGRKSLEIWDYLISKGITDCNEQGGRLNRSKRKLKPLVLKKILSIFCQPILDIIAFRLTT